jgi:hypothetical protein
MFWTSISKPLSSIIFSSISLSNSLSVDFLHSSTDLFPTHIPEPVLNIRNVGPPDSLTITPGNGGRRYALYGSLSLETTFLRSKAYLKLILATIFRISIVSSAFFSSPSLLI